jgi:hypothetical protein
MYKYLSWLLIALLLSGSARGQGVGIGVGLDDVRLGSPGAVVVPCTTFVTDYSVACNIIVLVTTGIAQ